MRTVPDNFLWLFAKFLFAGLLRQTQRISREGLSAYLVGLEGFGLCACFFLSVWEALELVFDVLLRSIARLPGGYGTMDLVVLLAAVEVVLVNPKVTQCSPRTPHNVNLC